MLLVFSSMKGLHFGDLADIYGYGFRDGGEFYHYLRTIFFKTEGAMYCIWEEQGRFCSALRLEPFADGLVLAGLETSPQHRRLGYGQKLVQEALAHLEGRLPVYSHIDHRNQASIALHQKCGFRRIKDTAQLLDGTTTTQCGTYFYPADSHIK